MKDLELKRVWSAGQAFGAAAILITALMIAPGSAPDAQPANGESCTAPVGVLPDGRALCGTAAAGNPGTGVRADADTDWSGYVAASPNPTMVSATIEAPKLLSHGTETKSRITPWVGLGGFEKLGPAGTLLQAGFFAVLDGTTATYQAWTEQVPTTKQGDPPLSAEPAEIPASDFAIKEGDKVNITVAYASATRTVVFTFLNETTSMTKVVTQLNSSDPPGASAEWIAERVSQYYPDHSPPSVGSQPEYSGMNFTKAMFTSTDGVTVTRGPGTASPVKLDLQGCDGALLGETGPINDVGDSFAVIWKAYGTRESKKCTQQIAAVRGGDGRLWWRNKGATWGAWDSIDGPTGGIFDGSPVVSAPSSGRVEVFVKGTDARLWRNSLTSTGWSGWTDHLNGSLLDSPAATVRGGNIDLAVRGTDGRLWTGTIDAQGTWSEFTGLDGPTGKIFEGTPAIAAVGPDQDWVAVRGTDNALWTNTRIAATGAWTGWQNRGGIITDGPSIAYNGNRYNGDQYSRPSTTDVFARGADGALWQKSYLWKDFRWADWQPVGGPNSGQFTGSPSVVASPSRTDVFVRGTDDQLWERSSTPGNEGFTAPWVSLGGITPDSPGSTNEP